MIVKIIVHLSVAVFDLSGGEEVRGLTPTAWRRPPY